uniref:Retrovirus-related Pol polyprotein from transposon TNT 1-94 n=1 Tax=Tanacetum cinerariifolium TaxID=118510 RepID=A0A6L2P5I9_TANCI|nr:hypothetical protein [Tanacetum cinerariifolium]
MLRDSVEHGPYKFKSKITVKDTNGVIDIRREEILEDLKGDYKLRYDSDIKAVNILLLGFPRSKFPPINNQLQTSSNRRTQATIQNGQVMVQNVQGRQSQGYVGNAGNNQASGARVINSVGNTTTNQLKDKMLLAQAQEAGVILGEEQHDFLVDSLEETDDCEELHLQATVNFKADHVDAYDSDCDDAATTNSIFMENLSYVGSLNDDTVAPHYDFDTLSKVPHYDTYHDSDVLNSNIQELGYTKNTVSNNESYDELKGNNDVISYTVYTLTIGDDADNYVPPHVQKNDIMSFVIE